MNRYPPFHCRPRGEIRDVSTKAGALALAADIRARWKECGVTIHTAVYAVNPGSTDERFGVRVEGLNGHLSGPA
jgi:hypothetical protein